MEDILSLDKKKKALLVPCNSKIRMPIFERAQDVNI